MKKSNHPGQVSHRLFTGLVFTTVLFVCIMSGYQADARFHFDKTGKIQTKDETDSANTAAANPEKKVDYLERIYFSGEDKEGLNTMILIAQQELKDKSPTASLAKQLTFLIDIEDNANDAKNACEVLDLLAVGIYSIDAAEAVQQGVKKPSDKAKAKSMNALASLNQLNSTSRNLSNSASNLAWSSFLLSGGKYSSFTSGASKVAGAAGAIGNVAGAAGATGETLNQVGSIAKNLFKKKDKPCDDVPKKNIELGMHNVPDTNKVAVAVQPQIQAPVISDNIKTITIKNISYTQLQTIGSAIEKVQGVTSVNSDKFESNTATIVINSNLKVKEIINKIFESNKALKFDIANTSATEANLVVK